MIANLAPDTRRLLPHRRCRRHSLADDLYQHPFAAAAVELAVKDLLPGSEVELTTGDRHDHFATHYLTFHMRVGVILGGAIVVIPGHRLMGRELLQPHLVVL